MNRRMVPMDAVIPGLQLEHLLPRPIEGIGPCVYRGIVEVDGARHLFSGHGNNWPEAKADFETFLLENCTCGAHYDRHCINHGWI